MYTTSSNIMYVNANLETDAGVFTFRVHGHLAQYLSPTEYITVSIKKEVDCNYANLAIIADRSETYDLTDPIVTEGKWYSFPVTYIFPSCQNSITYTAKLDGIALVDSVANGGFTFFYTNIDMKIATSDTTLIGTFKTVTVTATLATKSVSTELKITFISSC